MSKGKDSIKSNKHIKNFIKFFLCELLIIYCCFWTICNNQDIQAEDCNAIVGKIDDIAKVKRTTHIYINDKQCYIYGTKTGFSSYFDDMLAEKNVTILTNKHYNHFFCGTTNEVVDIRSNGYVYYSIDNYNESAAFQRVFVTIFAFIFGILILIIYLVYSGEITCLLKEYKKCKTSIRKVKRYQF